MYRARSSTLFAAYLVTMLMTPVAAAELGPPPGAKLRIEKLSAIDDFFKAEDASGRMPGAVVLIQRHGKPVYLKDVRQARCRRRDSNDGRCNLSDSFSDQDDHQRFGNVTGRSRQDRARRSRQQIHSVFCRHEGGHRAQGRDGKSGARSGAAAAPGHDRGFAAAYLRYHLRLLRYRGLVKAAYDGIYLGDFNNAEFAERIAKVPLAEQPRTLWDYGHSIDVLARVIEVASGQSLYQFEKENLLDPLGMTTTKFFLTDPAERARYAQPVDKDHHVERNSLNITRWESGGGGMVSTISDFARYGQMLLNGGTLDGKTYLSPTAFAALTIDHIGPGSGVARNYFYYPGDGFGFGYGFGVRTDPGNAVPPPEGSLGEIKWDGATGVYLVVDRAQDMFFVLMQNSPSDRMHVLVNLKKIIYGAFEK